MKMLSKIKLPPHIRNGNTRTSIKDKKASLHKQEIIDSLSKEKYLIYENVGAYKMEIASSILNKMQHLHQVWQAEHPN